jgi:arginine decarboxylase
VLPGQQRVEDPYSSDVSVSFRLLGSLLDHTELFGKAEKNVARALGADRAMFSVHGSSGSVFVVMRAISLMDPNALVLVARNVHHSVINALKFLNVDFRFLPASPGSYDGRFEALLPPSVGEVDRALDRHQEATAVIYTSPTNEGLTADTRRIAQRVHQSEAILVVDEAWGGHLPFHPDLPEDAMSAGADVALQSTHKLAGGLQQTGLILWKAKSRSSGSGRVDSTLMERAYREYITTSPSYHLVGSADAAIRALRATGRQALDHAIRVTTRFRRQLRRRVPKLQILDGAWRARHRSHVKGHDPIRTTCGLSNYGCTGFYVSDELAKRGIIVEKSGLNTITFITTFQLHDDAVPATVDALAEILSRKTARGRSSSTKLKQDENPFVMAERAFQHPHAVSRMAAQLHRQVALEKAVGEVAAESVELYPPGIPIIVEGFRVGPAAVDYLIKTRESLRDRDRPAGTVIARDTTLKTLWVL